MEKIYMVVLSEAIPDAGDNIQMKAFSTKEKANEYFNSVVTEFTEYWEEIPDRQVVAGGDSISIYEEGCYETNHTDIWIEEIAVDKED